jgi:glucose-6-phosphate isomerase
MRVSPKKLIKWDLSGVNTAFKLELDPILKKLQKYRSEISYNPPLFFNLPEENSKSIVEAFHFLSRYKKIVVIGVGGSSLGAEALVSLHGNQEREIIFLNNLDPFDCQKLIEDGTPRDTGYLVVSRSGTTTEVLAQFSLLAEYTKKNLEADWLEHWVAITNKKSGALRAFVERVSMRNLDFPIDLSGRYSVLSPVGLLPALLAGVDIERIKAGAQSVKDSWIYGQRYTSQILEASACYYLHHIKFNRTISVMMPYGSRFRKFAEWYSQLWAESLGKTLDNNTFAGSTPLVAIGTTDQHSILQLFVDGRDDKIYTILTVDDFGEPHEIPTILSGAEADYLSGKSLEDLTKVEALSTIKTLRSLGRPVINIQVPSVDEYFTGQLLFSYELITTAVASIYNINPFDQPGVEGNKNLILKMLSEL